MTDPSLSDHGRQVPSASPPVSDVDLRGVVPALEPQVALLTDDNGVRMLALAPPCAGDREYRDRDPCTSRGRHGPLQPVLDQRIAAGFHVDPPGHVASEAFQLAGED